MASQFLRDFTLKEDWAYGSKQGIICQPLCIENHINQKQNIVFLNSLNELVTLDNNGMETSRKSLGHPKKRLIELISETNPEFPKKRLISRDINKDNKPEIAAALECGRLILLSSSQEKLWEFRANAGFSSAPAVFDIDGDGEYELVAGSRDHSIYAIDRYGKLRWKHDSGAEVTSPVKAAAIGGRIMILFGSEDNNLHCLNPDGAMSWKFKTRGIITSRPSIVSYDGKDYIVVSSHDKHIYIIDSSGRQRSSIPTRGIVYSEVANSDMYSTGKPYLAAGVCSSAQSVALISQDRKTESFSSAYWVSSTPIIANLSLAKNKLVFGSHDNFLYVVDIEEGREMHESFLKHRLCGKVMSTGIVNDRLCNKKKIIASTDKGRIYSFFVVPA